MNVHVTGASGFLGRRVVPRLVAHNHNVTALVRSDRSAGVVSDLGATPVRGDLDRFQEIAEAFRHSGADALVNLVSLGFGHAPSIVSAAEDLKFRRVVFVSTTAIFTRLNASSKSIRVAAEETIARSGLNWTIVRPTMIYGDVDDRNMVRLLKLVRRTRLVPLPGGGHHLQQPVHVDDVADAVVAALECASCDHKIYDLGGPTPLTLRQVVEEAALALGRRPTYIPIPFGATRMALKLLERFHAPLGISTEQLERLAEDKTFNVDLARKELGFNPRAFQDGIRAEAELLRG